MPAIIGAGAQGVGALISGITGIFQKHKGNKLLKKLQFPTEEMPQEVLQNQAIAQGMANQGLPSEQYNKAMRDIQRQQLTALKSSSDRRGGLGLVSSIQQGTNDATLNLNSQDAMMKNANKKYLIGVNNNVANWRSQLFNNNIREKYNRDYNYAMNLVGAGNQNIGGGLDKLVAAGATYANAKSGDGNQTTGGY